MHSDGDFCIDGDPDDNAVDDISCLETVIFMDGSADCFSCLCVRWLFSSVGNECFPFSEVPASS